MDSEFGNLGRKLLAMAGYDTKFFSETGESSVEFIAKRMEYLKSRIPHLPEDFPLYDLVSSYENQDFTQTPVVLSAWMDFCQFRREDYEEIKEELSVYFKKNPKIMQSETQALCYFRVLNEYYEKAQQKTIK